MSFKNRIYEDLCSRLSTEMYELMYIKLYRLSGCENFFEADGEGWHPWRKGWSFKLD